jgi:hypothetical protein
MERSELCWPLVLKYTQVRSSDLHIFSEQVTSRNWTARLSYASPGKEVRDSESTTMKQRTPFSSDDPLCFSHHFSFQHFTHGHPNPYTLQQVQSLYHHSI